MMKPSVTEDMMTSQVARAAKRAMDGDAKAPHRLARRAMMIASAWIILSPSSFASPILIQYDFSGVITSAPASSGMMAGTPFSGSFEYNYFGVGPVETEGFYTFGTGGSPYPSSMSLSIGGQAGFNDSEPMSVSVVYLPAYGSSDTRPPSTTVTIANDHQNDHLLKLTLTNPSRTIKPSLTVPGTLSLSDFTTAQLDYIQKTASGNLEFQGTITAMTAAPEPAHATVICLAAGWLMIVRRAAPAAHGVAEPGLINSQFPPPARARAGAGPRLHRRPQSSRSSPATG
jgi:hypothetical protein